MFPNTKLTIDDIESNWAGLRPLIHQKNKAPSELSRKDEIFISESGLISIAGGKLTGYRKMAQRTVEAVLNTLKTDIKKGINITQTISLVNPSLNSTEEVEKYKLEIEKELNLSGITDNYYAWYLCSTYGKQSDIIISKFKDLENADVFERLIRAELWYCIHYEMVNSITDFFVRRTGRLYFDISNINKYLDIISNDCMIYLNWTTNRLSSEKEKLKLFIKDATTFYDEEFKKV